ncbi:Rrf2 family transcriptional regulator [Algimonas porphyrae]|uniref:HTH-type transcriptional regulator IscR n=1 Tax=Algimonas porphyrae TaxID=1128113 RepID=A0ABQ5UVP1_9PROT|nr:Rrf2 family transcriptional regulator [Algimonas porphyrae]GLQ19231.1 HTH-type transcriptional regulator IscR [Algimonas porphyrae]
MQKKWQSDPGPYDETALKLSAKGRTAVTAVADLATQTVIHGAGARVRLSDIAARQGLSQSFLEQVFSDLRRAGLVDSKRGPKGGYALTRPASEVVVSDVIAAVEEEVRAHGCRPEIALGCTGRTAKCLTHSLWGALEDHIGGFLDSVTVQMIVDGDLPTRTMSARMQTA